VDANVSVVSYGRVAAVLHCFHSDSRPIKSAGSVRVFARTPALTKIT
jgi:hypothetical protein